MTTLTKKDEAEAYRAPLAARSLGVTEVLKRARERVAAGWCQGWDTYADPCATSVCAQGAMWRALVSDFDDLGQHGSPAFDTFLRATRTFASAVGQKTTHWNDAHGRTQAEVLAAFDEAIALSEGNAPKAPKEAVPESPHGE